MSSVFELGNIVGRCGAGIRYISGADSLSVWSPVSRVLPELIIAVEETRITLVCRWTADIDVFLYTVSVYQNIISLILVLE